MNLTIRRKIVLGFGGALAALFLVSFLSYYSITQLQDATRWVQHSMGVIEGTQKIVLDLRKALVQYRAYLLTQDAQYLKPYQAGVWITLADLNDVKHLIGDNPEQGQNLSQVEVLVRKRLADINDGLALCAQGQFKRAFDISNSLDNLKLTQRIDESVQAV